MRNSRCFLLLFYSYAIIAASSVTPSAKTLFMTDNDVARILVPLGRSTTLSFPTRPSKVILGAKNVFAVEYIEQDIAVSALVPGAHCNLVVYLQGRRFSFDLYAVQNGQGGDEIVLVRDEIIKKHKKHPWKSKRKSRIPVKRK